MSENKIVRYRFTIACGKCGFTNGTQILTDAKNGALEHSRLCGDLVNIWDRDSFLMTVKHIQFPGRYSKLKP